MYQYYLAYATQARSTRHSRVLSSCCSSGGGSGGSDVGKWNPAMLGIESGLLELCRHFVNKPNPRNPTEPYDKIK